MTDYHDEIKRFVALFQQVKGDVNYGEGRLAEISGELQDVFHGIEFTENPDDGFMIDSYAKIRDLRKERRTLKDEQIILKPFLQWVQKNEDIVNSLTRVQGEIRKVSETLENRQYVKRNIKDEDE